MNPGRHPSLRKALSVCFYGLVLAFFNPAQAGAQTVWTGNSSTNWKTISNWNPGAVPNSSTDVIINKGSGNQPIITGTGTNANSLTIGLNTNSTANTSLVVNVGDRYDTPANVTLGDGTGSQGNVTVTNNLTTLTQWYIHGELVVGNLGSGRMQITNGSIENIYGSDANGVGMYIGAGANATGNVSVHDALLLNFGFGATPFASQLAVQNGSLVVGYLGNGTLQVANGGNVSANRQDANGIGAYIGYGANSTSSITVQDTADVPNYSPYSSQFLVRDGSLAVGYGGSGTLTVANGALVQANGGVVLGSQTGSHGTLAINSGGTLVIAASNGLTVGNGTGSVSMDGGILQLQGSPYTGLGGSGGGGGGVIVIITSPGGGSPTPSDTPSNNTVTSVNITLNKTNSQPNTIDTHGLNGTITGIFSGNGSLMKTGDGVLTLDAHETYTGDTIVNGGTLVEGTNGSIPSSSNLTLNGSTAVFDLGSNHSLTFATLTLDNGGNLTGTGNSTLTLTSNFQLKNGTVNVALAGGNHALMKTGNGTVTLAYNNTYTGGTFINGGFLNFNSGNNLGSGNIALNGGGLQWAANSSTDISSRLNPLGTGNDTFDTNGNNVTFSAVLSGNGTLVKTGNGTLTLARNNTYTGGTVINGGLVNFNTLSDFGSGSVVLAGGGVQWAANDTLDISAAISPLGDGQDTFDTNGNNIVFSANISGTGALAKGGNGTLTLSHGNNTYTGGTLVTGGQLAITGGNFGQGDADFAVGDQDYQTGLLAVSNGGNITGRNLILGVRGFANGTALISGANTTLNFTDTIYAGNYGIGNLTISNGARVTANTVLAGFQGNESVYYPDNDTILTSINSGSVLVTGANSSLIAANSIEISTGGDSNLTITNGGYVATTNLLTGDGNGSSTTLVSDPGSKLIVNYTLELGHYGTGYSNLTVSNAGNITANIVVIGSARNATALVTGANSKLQTSGDLAVGGIYWGGNGNGTLTVTNGATISVGGNLSSGGGQNNDQGSVTVTGPNSAIAVANNTFVGGAGEGNLLVANGGTMTINHTLAFSASQFGTSTTANGTGVVTDANSTLQVGQDIQVGGNGSLPNGIGCLTVSNGGHVSANGTLSIGFYSYTGLNHGNVLVTGANSTLDILNGVVVGNVGTGNLTLSTGGTLNLLAGSNLTLGQNSGSNGTVNLNGGGVLRIGGANGIQAGSGNYAFNLNGGTVQVSGGDLGASVNAALTNATTSTLDTNGFNATWSGAFSGNGNLAKAGAGTLTLSGTNTYTGTTTVTSGTLQISNNGSVSSTGSGALSVTSNGSLSGAGKIAGNTTVDGRLQPGAAATTGLLTFANNLMLDASAGALFQIGGASRGTQYAAVNTTGTLTLGGALLLKLLNSYLPGLGDTFSLFALGLAHAGSFASYSLPATGNGLNWNVSQLSSTGNITLAAPTTFAAWVTDSGLAGNSALASAKPWGGPPNLLRYALNMDLTTADAGAPSTTTSTLSGTPYLVIQYRVRKNMTDCTVTAQYSTNLSTWTNVDAGNISQLADADTYTAQYQARVVCPGQGCIYLRVIAQAAP